MWRTLPRRRQKEGVANVQHLGRAKQGMNKADVLQVVFNLIDLVKGLASRQKNGPDCNRTPTFGDRFPFGKNFVQMPDEIKRPVLEVLVLLIDLLDQVFFSFREF